MALVRIDSSRPRPPEELRRWAVTVSATMQALLGVPPRENHIICAAHDAAMVMADPDASPDQLAQTVFIQITLNQGRTAELKTRFMAQLAQDLAQACGADPGRVHVNLVEVPPENWRFSGP